MTTVDNSCNHIMAPGFKAALTQRFFPDHLQSKQIWLVCGDSAAQVPPPHNEGVLRNYFLDPGFFFPFNSGWTSVVDLLTFLEFKKKKLLTVHIFASVLEDVNTWTPAQTHMRTWEEKRCNTIYIFSILSTTFVVRNRTKSLGSGETEYT